MASLMLASMPERRARVLNKCRRAWLDYAWIGHALFAHPGGKALPYLHSRPSVQRIAARSLGWLEEQWTLGAQRGLQKLGELRERHLNQKRVDGARREPSLS